MIILVYIYILNKVENVLNKESVVKLLFQLKGYCYVSIYKSSYAGYNDTIARF
jgi:hypothetical protein